MHGKVNFYHTSKIGEERCVVIKKKQAKLAQVALLFKVMRSIIHITCIFIICLQNPLRANFHEILFENSN